MTMMRKIVRAQISTIGDREVEVVMSTAALARDGHILVPQGCQLENYRANPIVLWSHDPDHPVGNGEDIVVGPDKITARIRFAPAGVSRKADEVCGLMKSGVIRAVSVGFDPIEIDPLDPKKPRGGQRISVWELLEFSPVSVPADPGAVVTARSLGDPAMPETVATEAPASKSAPVVRTARAGKPSFKRGLYQVAQLCWLFEELGWHVDMAKYEAALEGDDSKVPAMLAALFHDLGEALVAMTEEEVAEALAGCDVEPDADAEDDAVVLVVEARAHIAAAKTGHQRAWRRGVAHAMLRAGKILSAETVRCLRATQALHGEVHDAIRGALRKHKAAVGAIDDMMADAGVTDEADSETEANAAADPPGESGDAARAADADYRRRQVEILGLRAA